METSVYKTVFPTERFSRLGTPFYYYDTTLLRLTLQAVAAAIPDSRYKVHYAIKANANPTLLRIIQEAGLGADCVSGGEIEAACDAGFASDRIVYAGVGKSDREIQLALDRDIACFNIESEAELRVISEIASASGKVARIAIRVNPDIDAHTHRYITTGLSENKFGINMPQLNYVIDTAMSLPAVELCGLHFHIGSQITDMEPYRMLCLRINDLQDSLEQRGVHLSTINVGGGLGIDYNNPERALIPDFGTYFAIFRDNLRLRDSQELHFELGRSIVAQCGSLITRVLYIKEGITKKFAIVDAGMTDLIRPALYQAHHAIESLTSTGRPAETYDVVGPICESSDCFATDLSLPRLSRGDMLAIRSAGAYGEIMASRYNLRQLPRAVYSDSRN